MRPLQRINLFLAVFLDTLRLFRLWRVWLFLFGYMGLLWLLLMALNRFTSPELFTPVMAWVELVAPNASRAFTHYPVQYVLIGTAFSWTKLAVGLLLEGLVFGAVTRLFARQIFDEKDERLGASKSLWGRYAHLVMVWVVLNGLMLAASMVVPDLIRSYINGPRRLMVFAFVLMPAIYTIILALLFTVFARVSVFGDSALRALGQSLKFAFKNPVSSLAMASLVLLVPALLGGLAVYNRGIIEMFRPELVYWLLVTGLVVDAFSAFFWMSFSVSYLAATDSDQSL